MVEQKRGTLSLFSPVNVKKSNSSNGKVRQSFSHGKTKVVSVVEVRSRRSLRSLSSDGSRPSVLSPGIGSTRSSGLTNVEMETRIKAVKDAIKESKDREGLRQIKEREQQELSHEQDQNEESETEQARNDAKQTDEVTDGVALSKGAAEIKSAKKAAGARTTGDHPSSHRSLRQNKGKDSDEEDFQGISPSSPKKVLVVKKGIRELRRHYEPGARKISLHSALSGEEDGRSRSLAALRRARQKSNTQIHGQEENRVIKDVVLPEVISVQDLSSRMAIRTGDVVKTLMKMGVMATANQIIDADTAELIVMEFGHNARRVSDIEVGLLREDAIGDQLPRPPVVTVMGHVDHGKTSLLDALRKTVVAQMETGGITQGIGAYQVTVSDGKQITFIDTPGHAAFTEMRSRGANVTDIVVLVVAADDSVKDQTIEAINHARAASSPIVVAINKIDKPDANPDNVRKDLLSHEVVVESYGGDVIDVEISAKTGTNLQKLEEAILLQAEMLDLKANPNRDAEGIVIESKVEKGLGPVATVLINKGTLRVGDIFVSGAVYGKVRAIRDHLGKNLREIRPGAPGEIIGFNGPTIPGDDFVVVGMETKAREIASYRDRKKREHAWVVTSSAEQIFTQRKVEEKLQFLSVIVKADMQGSSEAICASLLKLSTNEVSVKIIHSGIGEITENDASLAKASRAIILGFNVRSNMQARDQISRDHIQVRYYSIIYDLIDDMRAVMSGMLAPDIKENVLGVADVRKIFDISKFGRVAGCMVVEGHMKRSAKSRLVRDGVIVYTGEMRSLRRNKDDVKEVKLGFECGICLENYNDIHPGDAIECFELEEVARQL